MKNLLIDGEAVYNDNPQGFDLGRHIASCLIDKALTVAELRSLVNFVCDRHASYMKACNECSCPNFLDCRKSERI